MPVENVLDWSNAGANGSFAIGTGDTVNGVTITSTADSGGNTPSVRTTGSPAQEALWVTSVDEPITTTLSFNTPVTNVNFELFDVDQGSGWDDSVTVIAYDADGAMVEVDYSDLDGLHTVTGNTVDADGLASSGVETTGAEDSVTVSIAGPISRIEIIFDNGESSARTGVIGVSDMTFNNAPDGIVEGTANGDLINAAYVDDPEGDMITEGGDSVVAGDGDDTVVSGGGEDTIFSGDGNDSIEAGAGADTVEMGIGDDTFEGGAGNDSVNGDVGNDVLRGGTGNDWLRGSFGNDTLYSGGAGDGDDYLWGGYGDDLFVVENGFGNDTVDAENEDQINGDTLDLSAVTDDITIDLTNGQPEIGTVTDGTSTLTFDEIENIVLSSGTDTLVLSDLSGDDRVIGFTLPTENVDGSFAPGDLLDVSALTSDFGTTPVVVQDVTVTANADGDAVLSFPGGQSLTLVGVDPSDVSTRILEEMGIPAGPDGIVRGTESDDYIDINYVDVDGDRIDNNDAIVPDTSGNDDIVRAGGGNDTILSGDGRDIVDAGAGNDSVEGDVGNDVVSGREGDDTIRGGKGDDDISGGSGNDLLDGGAGADRLAGNEGNDTFVNITAGDAIFGGDEGGDIDTLDLTGAGPFRVVRDPLDSENGVVEFLDDDRNVIGTTNFFDIETIVPCFTPGTQIATVEGLKAVEDIEVGDMVFTRDHGAQPVRWVGHKSVSEEDLEQNAYLAPIQICKGAFGENLPDRDMLLSPNHRVLVNSPDVSLIFGESEVLAAAKHLVGRPGVTRMAGHAVTYVHFMFDRHEIVWSDSLWSESFQPGAMAIESLDSPQRDEIFALFPELEDQTHDVFPAARRVLRRHEVDVVSY